MCTMMRTLGPLLPRDFLERQPARWQRSQRKRGAIKALRRMQAKREKLEERAMRHRIADDASARAGTKPDPTAAGAVPAVSPAKLPAPIDSTSTSTGFGPHGQGFWAAHLAPNKPLVVSIPEGAQLMLLRAALAAGAPSHSTMPEPPTAVRCRVPSNKLPATLCHLQHSANGGAHAESAQLQTVFSAAKDGRFALAAEGQQTVHVIGCYKRKRPLNVEPAAASPAFAEGKAAGAARGVAAPSPAVATPAPKGAAKVVEAAAPATAPAPAAVQSTPDATQLRKLESGLKVQNPLPARAVQHASGACGIIAACKVARHVKWYELVCPNCPSCPCCAHRLLPSLPVLTPGGGHRHGPRARRSEWQ